MSKDTEEVLDGQREVIVTKHHTLFIDEGESQSIMLDIPKEHQGALGAKKVEVRSSGNKKYTLYTGTYQSEDSELYKILHELRNASSKDMLIIHIDSYGGYVSEGVTLTNIMKNTFYGNTTTILDPKGASMGAFVFGAGDKRIAHENSYIMYHNYSAGFQGKGGDLQAYTNSMDKILNNTFKKNIIENGYLSGEEYDLMRVGQDYYFDTEEMCYRGIATHVIVEGDELTAEGYVDYLESGLSYDEFYEMSEKDDEMGEEVSNAFSVLAKAGVLKLETAETLKGITDRMFKEEEEDE